MSDDILKPGKGKGPLRSKMENEDFYQGLDKGIRFAIRILHAHGLDTCQSCEGGEGHSYDWPTVDMSAGDDDAAGFIALGHLQSFGLPIRSISIHWPIRHGLPYEKLWRITFWKKMDDRADESLMFIWGYQAQAQKKARLGHDQT